MRINFLLISCSILLPFIAAAQYPPQVGNAGSTAIHKDSSIIIAWANEAKITRGLQNCTNVAVGYTTVGDSTAATGKADNKIVSLGDGGSATVTFTHPIKNGNGADFVIFENGFIDENLNPGKAFLELAFVEVSSDGIHFFRFPAISNLDTLTQVESFEGIDASTIHNFAGKYIANYGTPFDLEDLTGIPELDVNKITHVKIIDVVGNIDSRYCTRDSKGNKVNDPWPTEFPSGGFDLDAVGVIHADLASAVNEVKTLPLLSIYPNPATDNQPIYILPNTSQKFDFILTDIFGKQILSLQKQTNYTLQNLQAGVYFIWIKQGSSAQVQKIIVQ
ncbi:MAG: T9SS type A sorting domain-containing protein [Bacteroidia bacterium]|nr:T9SS type A sorting domain-containing protein [Bacteroidia bacterium]